MEERIDAAAAQGAPRESLGCTIGIGVGLTLVFLLVAGIGGLAFLVVGGEVVGGEDFDGPGYASGVFVGDELPFGLEVADATRFATGETIVRLARPDSPSDTEGGEAPPDGRAGPEEIVLVEQKSLGQARALFQGGGGGGGGFNGGEVDYGASAKLLEWERDPKEAWHTRLEAGQVEWSRWRADYRIERSFREGGGWRDSGRVDLSQEGRFLVLFAQWPVGVPATREGLRDVLRSVRMLESSGGE